MMAAHTDPSNPADRPPLVSTACPGFGAATTVRVSIPGRAGAPLVKRAAGAAQVRRFGETALVGGEDEAVSLLWHVRKADALAEAFTRRRGYRGRSAASGMALSSHGCAPPPGGRLSPDEAAERFGYVARRPPAVVSPAGPHRGDVSRFYGAVASAAARQARSDGESPVSCETEGLLSALTAFRYGLQRMESRRRWLGAAAGSGQAPPVGADGRATEPFPCAVR